MWGNARGARKSAPVDQGRRGHVDASARITRSILWDDVEIGPECRLDRCIVADRVRLPARSTYTLKDMDEASLRVLAKRRDLACVLVNPVHALYPNRGAPGDAALVDSGRSAGFDRAAYTAWLRRLRWALRGWSMC